MSRYHHSSKAGNPADVHKHWLLGLLLAHYTARGDTLCYLESHAGCGHYRAPGTVPIPESFKQGIAKLWHSKTPLPCGLQQYLQIVRKYNPRALCNYPGSPLIAKHLLKPSDRAVLFELHGESYQQLHASMNDKRFSLYHRNGYHGVIQRLPLCRGRPIVLIDPPYVERDESRRVAQLLQLLVKHPRQPVVIAWYPIRKPAQNSPRKTIINKLSTQRFWCHEITMEQCVGHRLSGSGMLLINAPKSLARVARSEGNALSSLLGAGQRIR